MSEALTLPLALPHLGEGKIEILNIKNKFNESITCNMSEGDCTWKESKLQLGMGRLVRE